MDNFSEVLMLLEVFILTSLGQTDHHQIDNFLLHPYSGSITFISVSLSGIILAVILHKVIQEDGIFLRYPHIVLSLNLQSANYALGTK